MRTGQIILRSPDAFHKWSDERRTQLWDMIERLGKGEVTCKEAREILRQEKKALDAVSKQGRLRFWRSKTKKFAPGIEDSSSHPR
jgi:hypothetical protein